MKEFIEKISSYNLFNNLLPGILFAIIAKQTTKYDLIQSDILLGLFLYYFIGLIISRFGSLVFENILIKLKFVNYANYKDFVQTQKEDSKIDSLLESNNMFRTLSAMGFLLLFLKLYEYISIRLQIDDNITCISFVILIMTLFLFSYRKQTSYIRKRVEIHTKNKS